MFFKLQLKFKSKKAVVSNKFIDKKQAFWKPFLLILPAFILIITFSTIPFFLTIQNSFYTPKTRREDAVLGFQYFKEIFQNPFFKTGIRNSFLYALISLPISLTIGILISALITHVYRKVARGFWQTIFFLPYVTSSIAIAISFFYIFDTSNGFLNKLFGDNIPWLTGEESSYYALGAMILYGLWKNMAFNILLITTAMLSVDKTLYKAASIDGASKTKQFFSITLPLINKTISLLVTLGIIGGIKAFPLALFNNDVTTAKLHGGMTLLMFVYENVVNGKFGLAGAASLILFLLGISFAIILRNGIKYFVIGLEKWGERNILFKIKSQKLP